MNDEIEEEINDIRKVLEAGLPHYLTIEHFRSNESWSEGKVVGGNEVLQYLLTCLDERDDAAVILLKTCRERDEALAEIERLRERRSEDQLHMIKVARLLDEAATAAYRERELVREIRDSLKAADVHECYRGVRSALEHYDERRERGDS